MAGGGEIESGTEWQTGNILLSVHPGVKPCTWKAGCEETGTRGVCGEQ